jgi:hypothetical protein
VGAQCPARLGDGGYGGGHREGAALHDPPPVVATVYVVGACVASDLDDGDDDNRCARCGETSCICTPAQKRAPPQGSVNKYRNKNP